MMAGNYSSRILKTLLILGVLSLTATIVACSGGGAETTAPDSRADQIAAKEQAKDKLPPVSSIKQEQSENIQITAVELVKRLNKNNSKKNIKAVSYTHLTLPTKA